MDKDKSLLQSYRKDNLLLTDKLETAMSEKLIMKNRIDELEKELKDATEKRDYWKVKYNRNSSWFTWSTKD